MIQNPVPKLITFDGEARSGKGTIVSAVKDYVRDEMDKKVMLIDAGQVFRVLVIAATKAGIDLEKPDEIDAFLSDEAEAERCVQLVKAVYHMKKTERDALLYTNEIGQNSAKIGARSKSQEFKDMLLKKWLRDARTEGYEIVLLDGRALEEVGTMLENDKLCDFIAGFYFVCDPIVGARRTLGFAATSYDELSESDKKTVDELVEQIRERNRKDIERSVQPVVPPKNASKFELPDLDVTFHSTHRQMMIVDTSKQMTISEMTKPLVQVVAQLLQK